MKTLKIADDSNYLDLNKVDDIRGDRDINFYLNANNWGVVREQLNLTQSKLVSLDGVEKLIYLKFLNVSYNKLRSLKGIEGLTKLRDLRVSHNQLTSLHEVQNLKNLETLYISDNQISSLKDLKHLTNLSTLEYAGNPLNDVKVYPDKSYKVVIMPYHLEVDGTLRHIGRWLAYSDSVLDNMVSGLSQWFKVHKDTILKIQKELQ